MSLTFADRMRSTPPTAIILGLLIFLVLSVTALIPFIGLFVWLILGPYLASRVALREHGGRRIPYALLLGIIEASLLVGVVLVLLQVVMGGLFFRTMEVLLVALVYGFCMVFSVIGAWTLQE